MEPHPYQSLSGTNYCARRECGKPEFADVHKGHVPHGPHCDDYREQRDQARHEASLLLEQNQRLRAQVQRVRELAEKLNPSGHVHNSILAALDGET